MAATKRTDPPAFENDHNVYILGAGFSAPAGIPVVRPFLSRMRQAVSWLQAQGRDREARSIHEALRFRQRAASASHRVVVDPDNIEELFCLASATDQGEKLTTDMTIAIAATIDFAAHNPSDRFLHSRDIAVGPTIPPPRSWRLATDRVTSRQNMRVYSCPLYDLIVGLMLGTFSTMPNGMRTSFISFNYDTVLEGALDSLGADYTYGFGNEVNYDPDARCKHVRLPSSDTVAVLKLHGSMNWGNTGRKITVYNRYDSQNLDKTPPLLIPPTWRKVFRKELALTWDGAINALSTATRIIVIGFSLPPTDVHFKYLLAAGLQRNISLRELTFVNPQFRTYDRSDQDTEAANQLRQRVLSTVRPELLSQGILRFEGAYVEECIGTHTNWIGRLKSTDIEFTA